MTNSNPSARLDTTPVAVFHANLYAPPSQKALVRLLTPEELRRASRFRSEKLRRRWVTSRGLLRALLGLLLQQDPRKVTLETTPEGKPYLPEGPAFNLSHAGPNHMVAVAFTGEVGVDNGKCRQREDLDALVAEYFAPEEAAEISSLPALERFRAFLRTWVLKEAFLKCLGLAPPIQLRPDFPPLPRERPAFGV